MGTEQSPVVMNKETARAANVRRKLKHDEKIAKLREILIAAGYNATGVIGNRRMEIEFFIGVPGSVVLVVLCNQKNHYHADILIPLEYAKQTDETTAALRSVIAS